MTEQWTVVKGYSDYMVSENGEIKSFKYREPRIMKPFIKGGYRFVELCSKEKSRHERICRIVYDSFKGIPDGKIINHIDSNRLNDNIKNLEVVNYRENMSHRFIAARGFTGASYHKRAKKWAANIHIDGERIHIGYFLNKEDAMRAYKNVCRFMGFENKYAGETK